uniref:Myb/SANT-like DNA-binding domain-containing protein n=1 Tax=Magallana gigas TaxID=29159 RepID=K1QJN2_MAGGI
MAENDIESLISAAKRKRGANWSSEEQIVLIEEVLKYEDKLFGKMKGAGAKGKHGKIKEETWQSISDRLNSQFRNERTSDLISKKYDNIKQRDKIDGIRRPKTGGGPPPAPLTQAEEALYQAMDTRPTIVGLVGGIDTDGTKCSFY